MTANAAGAVSVLLFIAEAAVLFSVLAVVAVVTGWPVLLLAWFSIMCVAFMLGAAWASR